MRKSALNLELLNGSVASLNHAAIVTKAVLTLIGTEGKGPRNLEGRETRSDLLTH